MSVSYPRDFREALVRRLTGPNPESKTEVSEETGVHQTTLCRWVREAGAKGSLAGMTKSKNRNRNRNRNPLSDAKAASARRPQDWNLEEKLQVLLETTSLSDEELGAYLRRKGLHEAQLVQWREAVAEALQKSVPKPKIGPEQKAQKRRIQQLERELNRKEKALAEAAALLVLKKKAQMIWGGGDDDINVGNDR